MLKVLLPAEFLEEHRRIVLEYMRRGHTFQRDEWRLAIDAFDLLKEAMVLISTGFLPFPIIYRQQVEDHYADVFIEQLYEAAYIEKTSTTLWADVATKIAPNLAQQGLYRRDIPATRLIVAYCLYWWRSFTLGYALEIEIQRDLTKTGLQFEAHDLRRREERLSASDLVVSGFKGDIKTSLYFLQAARSQLLAHDFYITKVQGQKRSRTLVVFMQTAMWETIDGETLLVLLSEIADTLPQAMRLVHQGVELTIIDYDVWKEKVQFYQTKGKKHE